MESVSLTQVVETQLEAARANHSGRAAQTIRGGHDHSLRETVIALAAGRELGEHESPGEATLQVLTGRVRLTAGDESCECSTGTASPSRPTKTERGTSSVEEADHRAWQVAGLRWPIPKVALFAGRRANRVQQVNFGRA